jgi:hypothetical protein
VFGHIRVAERSLIFCSASDEGPLPTVAQKEVGISDTSAG